MLVRVDAFLAAAALPLLFGYDLLTRRDARRWLYPGIPLAVFAGGIVGFELIPNTLDWRGPLWTTFLLLLAALFGIRVLGNLMVKNFPCPRCKQTFVRLSLWDRASLTTLERRAPCQHCALPMGQLGEG